MATHDKFVHLNKDLYDYMVAHGRNRDPLLALSEAGRQSCHGI